MNKTNLFKVAILAWGVPLANVVVALFFTPDPNRKLESFPSKTFVPTEIRMSEGSGRRNSIFYEVRLHSPDGDSFYLKDPAREPIAELDGRIPRDVPLKIVYSPKEEGNVLMAIDRQSGDGEPILSFENVMAEYASRRRLVYTIAGVWFVVGNAALIVLWKKSPT